MVDNISYFRHTIVRQVLIFLFLISGISVSIFVIVWIRLFKLVFGNFYFVTNFVLVTFILGLAIGGYYFGKKIDKKRNELQMFMWFELVLGLYILFLLIIFPVLTPLNKIIFLHTGDLIVLKSVFKFLITFVLLITPSVLIGATFPILSRFFIQSSNRVSREIGNLYGIIMLGAVLGCYLSGFVFLQIFGVRQTLIFGAVLSLFIATVVRFLLKKIEPTVYLETEFYDQQLKHLDQVTITGSPLLKRALVIGISISGFLSISYLVLWLKSFIYILENNTYTIHIMLTVFFAGVSIGAFLYPRFLEKGNLFSKFAIIEIIIGVLGIISIMLIPQLYALNENLLSLLHDSTNWSWRAIVYFYDSSIILFLPATLIGMTVPLGCKIYLTNFEERGKKIGSIYAANAIGNILGLNITALLLLPNVGIQKSIIFLALINFLIGLVILFLATLRYGKIFKTSIIFAFVAITFCLSLFMPANMIVRLFENAKKGNKVLYVKEGINTTVTIHQDVSQNHLTLISNGMSVAGTSKDWLTIQRLHGHLPLLLHSNPDMILTIGFRDGETLKSIFLHHVKQVDCIENTPEIVTASSLINVNRYDLASNPDLHIIPVDYGNFISLSNKNYDIIFNDIVHPAFDGNASLYTSKYFRTCREHLNPGGIMSCAIPIFKISIEDFKVLINTFHSIFPGTTLWYNNDCLNQYALLIGSIDPEFRIDYNHISNKLNDPGIILNLTAIGMDNIYEILDSFIMGPEIIKELAEGVRINRENIPHLEFSAPKTVDTPSNWNQALQLLANYRESVFPYLTNIDSTLEQREFVRLVVENYYQSTELVFDALRCELLGKPERALQIYRQVYMMNRFDRGAKRYLDSYYDSLLVASPQTPAELIQNATVYYQKMDYEVAINLVNKALELNPDYAPAYFALGINYEIKGDLKKAKKMYQKTLKLKPNLQQAKDRLDSLSMKSNN